MNKQLVLIATAIMSTLLALVALWQFRIVLIYVLISLLIAAMLRSPARNQSRRNPLTRFGITLRYMLGLVVSILVIVIVGRFLGADFQRLVETLSVETPWMLPEWFLAGSVQQELIKWVPTPNQLLAALTGERQSALSAVLGITQGIGGILSALIIILFLSVYWSINQNHFERLWLSLLPADLRKRARFIWRTIEQDLGAYARSELIQAVLAMVLLGVGYWLLGSPYPMLLAVTGALAWMVPLVGAALATILPLLLGLLTSTPLALYTIAYTLLVLLALQIWVEPRLFRLKWDNPVLTFVILLAMADAFGILGIIAAPPVSVVCQTLWKFLVTDRQAATSGLRLEDLKEQQARLQGSIDQMHGTPAPLVASSMQRLTELIDKAGPILKENQQPEARDLFRAS